MCVRASAGTKMKIRKKKVFFSFSTAFFYSLSLSLQLTTKQFAFNTVHTYQYKIPNRDDDDDDENASGKKDFLFRFPSFRHFLTAILFNVFFLLKRFPKFYSSLNKNFNRESNLTIVHSHKNRENKTKTQNRENYLPFTHLRTHAHTHLFIQKNLFCFAFFIFFSPFFLNLSQTVNKF